MSTETKAQPVLIQILGKEYRIACSEQEQESLLRSAKILDEQMRKIRDTGKVSGSDRIAVMAALNLAHEQQTEQAGLLDIRPASDDINLHLVNMRQKIEKALKISESR